MLRAGRAPASAVAAEQRRHRVTDRERNEPARGDLRGFDLERHRGEVQLGKRDEPADHALAGPARDQRIREPGHSGERRQRPERIGLVAHARRSQHAERQHRQNERAMAPSAWRGRRDRPRGGPAPPPGRQPVDPGDGGRGCQGGRVDRAHRRAVDPVGPDSGAQQRAHHPDLNGTQAAAACQHECGGHASRVARQAAFRVLAARGAAPDRVQSPRYAARESTGAATPGCVVS